MSSFIVAPAIMTGIGLLFAVPTFATASEDGLPGQESLPAVAPLPRAAHVALFGDFLSDVEDFRKIVTGYAGRGVRARST